MKRDIDQEIAQIVHDQEEDTVQLEINEDTSYDINFGTYDNKDEKYFYIKMTENTAKAPFYYIRSYTIKELHELHNIYKVFEKDNLDNLKNYMRTLFDKNKISLKFEEDEVIIKMDIKAQLFADDELLFFELYREMIPNKEKDEKLLDIYALNKKEMKALKEITYFINNFKGNQKEMEFIKELKNILSLKEIPGIEEGIQLELGNPKDKEVEKEIKNEIIEENIIQLENPKKEEEEENIIQLENPKKEEEEENINKNEIIENPKEEENENKIIENTEIKINENDNDNNNNDLADSDISIKRKSSKSLNSQIFTNLQKHYRFNAKAGNFNIALNIKNIFDEEWKGNEIQLKCNEKDSNIKFSKVINFPFDLPKGQDNDFTLVFNEEDMKKGTYKCYIDLHANGKKITDHSVRIKIIVKE